MVPQPLKMIVIQMIYQDPTNSLITHTSEVQKPLKQRDCDSNDLGRSCTNINNLNISCTTTNTKTRLSFKGSRKIQQKTFITTHVMVQQSIKNRL